MAHAVGDGTAISRWFRPRAQIVALRRIAALDALARQDGAEATRLIMQHAHGELTRPTALAGFLRSGEVEALQAVDAAELELLRNGSDTPLIAALPAILDRVRTELPEPDGRRQALES